jgi:hypothetical protein
MDSLLVSIRLFWSQSDLLRAANGQELTVVNRPGYVRRQRLPQPSLTRVLGRLMSSRAM